VGKPKKSLKMGHVSQYGAARKRAAIRRPDALTLCCPFRELKLQQRQIRLSPILFLVVLHPEWAGCCVTDH